MVEWLFLRKQVLQELWYINNFTDTLGERIAEIVEEEEEEATWKGQFAR